jgi:hypothetical protein
MLLPHSERWLDHHFPEALDHGEPIQRLAYCAEDTGSYRLYSSFGVRPNRNRVHYEGYHCISNVHSIEFRAGSNHGLTLIEQDFGTATAGQWWLFASPKFSLDGCRVYWVLINYKERRMYVGPNASEALVWKGKDVFCMETWARLRIMEDIEILGGIETMCRNR